MAESPEHYFLKTEFLKVLEDFSSTQIYGYSEGDRKKYDMSCSLKRDWERPLVGQTMWSHEKGIDKDLRMLLTTENADIWAYVLKDSIKARATLYEIVQDYKNSKHRDSLFKLKVFWVPNDFDADKEIGRDTVAQILKNSIVDDLLFNVVFGNLTSHDFTYFIRGFSGFGGLQLAILNHIALKGIGNYVQVSEALGVSKSPIRERTGQLQAKGFITGTGILSHISLKGRVLLSIIKRFISEHEKGEFSKELIFILSKLGQTVRLKDEIDDEKFELSYDLKELLLDVKHAKQFITLDFDEAKYIVKGDL